ncbi:glycosyltransferase family 4 protein [Oscillibacter sp.]|uniref:glycosyltransferase family 4 protein n=2 Tax=Oscillibacter TaxID=459786 RepID=UPI002173819F|nr:glycosyltransferase [Oscillibacter sp.]MCI9648370.1 glycosyltransferase [Oscillibacter sp.]
MIIANCTVFQNGELVPVPPCDKILDNGLRLVRLPYEYFLTGFLAGKIRRVRGLYKLLEDFAPEVILSHSLSYWSALDVIRYKKDHPEVKLYADTHTAAYNSGRNWLSLHVLHRGLYRYLIQKTLPYLEKYFYIGEAERQFSVQNYGVPESLMEFYPLGGTLLPEEEYKVVRSKRRAELGLAEGTALLIHSGKLDSLKRTDALLRSFTAVPGLDARLVVIGSIPEDRKELLMSLIEADKRVVYLGWKSGAELQEYLCACDLYCQPGGVSATMQNAVCRGCAILSAPHEAYTVNLDYGNFLWVKTEEEMSAVFRQLQEDPELLDPLREDSRRCARELLDYRKLAARLYQ